MIVIGRGNTAEIIARENNKVYKLFYQGYPYGAVNREYCNAQLMQRFDIPMPKVYGIVSMKDRTGIIYERLYGQSLLIKLMENEGFIFYVDRFVDLHKKILGYHTCEGMCYKDFLYLCIEGKCNHNSIIYKQIEKLGDGDCLCHGDYHPGNVWIDESGKTLVIDFMNVCHGPWQYDVARTYVLISQGNLPEGISNIEELRCMQQELAEAYLRKLNVSYDEISEYVEVIKGCRKYELNISD